MFFTLCSVIVSFGQNIAELKQKAEQGDALVQYYLGLCYADGDGVKKTHVKLLNGLEKLPNKVMPRLNIVLVCVMLMTKV